MILGKGEYAVDVSDSGFVLLNQDERIRIDCFTWVHSEELPQHPAGLVKHPKGGVIRRCEGFEHAGDIPASEGIPCVESSLVLRNSSEEIQLLFLEDSPGLVWRRLFRGCGDRPIHAGGFIEEVRVEKSSVFYPSDNVFCFHAENPRLYNRYCMGVLEDRTSPASVGYEFYEKECDTFWGAARHYRPELGKSPFQPFPAIVYGNRQDKRILIEGTLSQNRLYRHYRCKATDDEKFYVWTQEPKTINALVVQPGETLCGEWNYLELSANKKVNHPFRGYIKALETMCGEFRGAKSDNREHMVWGSWNCGIFRDIDQESILATADYIKDNLPSVKWIQIDDGYDEWDYGLCRGRIGIGVAYEGEGASRSKFPEGMRHFTDEVKKRGLHPALWVGLHVATNRQPYLDHPEWFIPYGTELGAAILDVSREDVRQFVKDAYRLFTEDWGFEGVKFDFWSYIFEEEAIPLPSGTVTGTEYRTWYMRTVREMLPEHGYIQTGCDIAMANPHLGLYADNYRYGKDVGNGEWKNIVTNARWAAFCVNTHSGHLFIPNSDSIGIMPGLEDVDLRTHVNFCLISRTLVEIAGWLHRDSGHPMMPFIRKACCCPRNGEDVFFGDFDFTASDEIPPVWYLKSPHFSRLDECMLLPVRTVAVFNWSDDTVSRMEIDPGMLGLDPGASFSWKDYWSDATGRMDKRLIELAPHESVLFTVFDSAVGPGVVDCNALVDAVTFDKGDLVVGVECAGALELTVTGCVRKVCVEGEERDAVLTVRDGMSKVLLDVKGKREVRLCLE